MGSAVRAAFSSGIDAERFPAGNFDPASEDQLPYLLQVIPNLPTEPVKRKSTSEAAILLQRPALAASHALHVGLTAKLSVDIVGLSFLPHDFQLWGKENRRNRRNWVCAAYCGVFFFRSANVNLWPLVLANLRSFAIVRSVASPFSARWSVSTDILPQRRAMLGCVSPPRSSVTFSPLIGQSSCGRPRGRRASEGAGIWLSSSACLSRRARRYRQRAAFAQRSATRSGAGVVNCSARNSGNPVSRPNKNAACWSHRSVST